jgi:hypothetical protein
VKVFGKEHGGFARSMGLGVTPSQLTTTRSPRLTSSSEDKEKMKQMQADYVIMKEKHNSNGNQVIVLFLFRAIMCP